MHALTRAVLFIEFDLGKDCKVSFVTCVSFDVVNSFHVGKDFEVSFVMCVSFEVVNSFDVGK